MMLFGYRMRKGRIRRIRGGQGVSVCPGSLNFRNGTGPFVEARIDPPYKVLPYVYKVDKNPGDIDSP